jgi:hypothetical protein
VKDQRARMQRLQAGDLGRIVDHLKHEPILGRLAFLQLG